MESNNRLTFLQEWCKVLNKKEQWKKVSDLANTSYVGTNPKTREVLAFFIKKKKIDIHQLTNADAFSQYSNIHMKAAEWKKMNTQIPAACRIYTQIELSKDDIHSNLNMQKYYMENGMEKYLEAKKIENKEAIIDSPVKDNYYGYYLTRLKEMELWDTKVKDARQKMIELNDWENAIEFFYHENKLRILVSRLNRASFKKVNAISHQQQSWVDQMSETIKEIPQVAYHAMLYDIFANENDATFEKLWQILESGNFDSRLDEEEYARYLSAYCIHRTTKGHFSFHGKYVDIIRFLKKKGKLLEMGYLPATKLKNIIKSILESQKCSQCATEFLDLYKDKIPDTQNSMIITYCEALILFYEGKYTDAKEKLAPIAGIKNKKGKEDLVKDDFTKIGIRYLYMMILIGLDNFNEMENLPKNLQEMFYVKSEHIAKKYAKNYQRGLHFINQIISSPPYRMEEYIIKKMEEESYFRGKKWIKAALIYRKKGDNILLPPQINT